MYRAINGLPSGWRKRFDWEHCPGRSLDLANLTWNALYEFVISRYELVLIFIILYNLNKTLVKGEHLYSYFCIR